VRDSLPTFKLVQLFPHNQCGINPNKVFNKITINICFRSIHRRLTNSIDLGITASGSEGACLVLCIWPNQTLGVQQSCDWLPVLRPKPGPRHVFLPPPPASRETPVDSVSWEPGSRGARAGDGGQKMICVHIICRQPNMICVHHGWVYTGNQTMRCCMTWTCPSPVLMIDMGQARHSNEPNASMVISRLPPEHECGRSGTRIPSHARFQIEQLLLAPLCCSTIIERIDICWPMAYCESV